MRRLSRIDGPIVLLQRQRRARIPFSYVCSACKHQATSFSTSALRATPSNEKAPFTEKVRRKLWGTDNPPGLENPYGDGSVFDKTENPARKQEIEAREQELEQGPVEIKEITPENEASAIDDSIQFGESKLATTWEGLQWVGGGPVWQPEDDFKGFVPADAVTSREEITAALHRAVVEVFALQQSGTALHELSTYFPEFDGNDWTKSVQITPSSSGATLQMPDNASLQEVMESLAASKLNKDNHETEPTESEADIDADRTDMDPLDSEATSTDVIQGYAEPTHSGEVSVMDGAPADALAASTCDDVFSSWDPSWLQISLENPEVKFAVLKRTMQLTGIRIPDVGIKSSDTAKALLNIFVTPPKPRKLFEALEQKTDLPQLENVAIYPAKRTFYSKERDIGRLKIIKKELEARHLNL